MEKIEEKLKKEKIGFKKNVSLARYTTTKVGGKADIFIVCRKEEELIKVFNFVMKNNIDYLIIGGGSNLLISDEGFKGVVILNEVKKILLKGESIFAKSGTYLSQLVSFSAAKSLTGIEELAGIPGTVGGAIYGNAGAYGKSASCLLTKVKIADGKKVYWINKSKIDFSYRESSFKKDKKLILEAEFKLKKTEKKKVLEKYKKIIKDRAIKYKKGLYCPGSFFKNIEANDIPQDILKMIPLEKIVYGKIPAGNLLESVSAKGLRKGDVEVSEKHANFFINKGKGKAKDYYDLAMSLREKVFEKFGINLEPEVQIIGFKK